MRNTYERERRGAAVPLDASSNPQVQRRFFHASKGHAAPAPAQLKAAKRRENRCESGCVTGAFTRKADGPCDSWGLVVVGKRARIRAKPRIRHQMGYGQQRATRSVPRTRAWDPRILDEGVA